MVFSTHFHLLYMTFFLNESGRRAADYIKKKMKPRLSKQQMKINYKATPDGWIRASASTGLNSTPTNARSDWDIDTTHDENPA